MSKFSDFIRNATDAEKEAIYLEVLERVTARQAEVMRKALESEPMHMILCEFGKLVPRPNQAYIAVHIPGCAECDRIASEQREAYGVSSPTVNTDGSLGQPVAPALGWCEYCGEGVTGFCRGKVRSCPKGLPIPGSGD